VKFRNVQIRMMKQTTIDDILAIQANESICVFVSVFTSLKLLEMRVYYG